MELQNTAPAESVSPQHEASAPRRVLRRPAVLAKISMSSSTLDRMVAAGTFPRPVRLAPRAIGWIEHEIDAWVSARGVERGAR